MVTSMYAQLLTAALRQNTHVAESDAERQLALEQLRQCRYQLEEEVPPALEFDTVAIVLARQVRYDAALLRLAQLVGIETGPSRFDRPGPERARLEHALLDLGFDPAPTR